MMRPTLIVLAIASLLSACSAPTNEKLTIAVIPKATSHTFWRSIHAGAEKAAREVGVDIIWRGPLREDDRSGQVSEVQGFVTRGVSGIVLAPLDNLALVAPVAEATHSRIPVVIIDSGLKTEDYVSFVATNNTRAGELAGDALAQLLPDGGRIVLLRYAEGSASTTEREDGFLSAIGTYPTLQVISSNQYGGSDMESAYRKGESLLSRFKAENGSLAVDGIFCPNESTTHAMLRVLIDNGWAGKVKFIGFDATDALVKGMTDGHINGLILQDPVKMGYLGVKAVVAHIRGESVPRRIDTGVQLVTRENMSQPAMNDLLHPALGQ